MKLKCMEGLIASDGAKVQSKLHNPELVSVLLVPSGGFFSDFGLIATILKSLLLTSHQIDFLMSFL